MKSEEAFNFLELGIVKRNGTCEFQDCQKLPEGPHNTCTQIVVYKRYVSNKITTNTYYITML